MFIPNPHLARELAKDESIRKQLRQHGNAIKEQAVSLSPRGVGPGGYETRFRVTDDGETVRVENTDIAAHLVEYGSANNPPYAPLRGAVGAAGLRFEEEGK